ncbi:uncharacterized protein LOC124354758 [Homalodisca vitripennis]|uniref:uncharacterized protein LOC124354758 n=1 Tax=Homalodisca vitripennis TaxID=197043 RepID=UPI001EEB6980|nr:uncharacterized protein LOC124354758 [Homalodisca vitripennis]
MAAQPALLTLLAIIGVVSASVDTQRYPNSQEPLTIKGIVTSIRYALSASPTYLAKQRWHFDPEVSKRRNREYERIHGHHSVYLIERLGLGEDGREEERRRQQAIRDIGVPITG